MSEFASKLRQFLDYVEKLEIQVDHAKAHIRKHLDVFSPSELECMVLDGLISPYIVPKEKQTDYVASLLKKKE
jgi:hypothetical protein